jgi:hypothetical protein
MHTIITSIGISPISNQYICNGPNIPSYDWLKEYKQYKMCMFLVIVYGGSLFAPNGWRNATCNIIVIQRRWKKRKMKKQWNNTVLFTLINTKLPINITRYISDFG